MSLVHNNKALQNRRKMLRKKQTLQEELLWNELRANRIGLKFKRQHSIGGYILDFYCAKKKLIVELDGAVHNTLESKEYDEVRDRYFKELGYTTLRFRNFEVETHLDQVVQKIKDF